MNEETNPFRVGDLADHISGGLDPREVVAVEGDKIQLDLLGKTSPWLSAGNYIHIPVEIRPSTTEEETEEESEKLGRLPKRELIDSVIEERERSRELSKALREAVSDIESGRVGTVGYYDIHSPQIPVKSVERWRGVLEGSNG